MKGYIVFNEKWIGVREHKDDPHQSLIWQDEEPTVFRTLAAARKALRGIAQWCKRERWHWRCDQWHIVKIIQ